MIKNDTEEGSPLTLKAFAVALANSIIARGIDKETAVSTVLRITRSLSEEDQREIAGYESPDDFVTLSDALTKLIEDEKRASIIENATAETISASPMSDTASRHFTAPELDMSMYDTRAVPPVHTGSVSRPDMADTRVVDTVHTGSLDRSTMAETRTVNTVRRPPAEDSSMAATKNMNAVHTGTVNRPDMAQTKAMDAVHTGTVNRPAAPNSPAADPHSAATQKNIPIRKVPVRDDSYAPPLSDSVRAENAPPEKKQPHYTEYKKTKLTSRGAKFFWTFFALALPFICAIAIAYFVIFALCVVSVCALIVAFFIILSAVIIAGSLIFLVSIIYGIIQMFSSLGIGIYEIGVGIVTSGLAILLSVLVYLAATRAMPYLLKQLIAFTGHTLGQLPGLWDKAREECNKL